MNDEPKKISLLLVDDEDDFRISTSRALGRRGFDVHLAASGEEALETLHSLSPDVVLLDLRMEGMDGIATLRRLRESHEAIPVIILTGHGCFDDAVAGIHLDVVEFLQKPVDVEKLAALVRRLLAKGQPRAMRERTIGELMIPLESYRHIYGDEPISAAIEALQESFFQQVTGKLAEQGHRSVIVYDRDEHFLGLIRIADVVAMCIPAFLRNSAYASCFTGMFLAQCKTMGKLQVSDLLSGPCPSIDLDAPLMEAVHQLTTEHQINLPVMREGRLVGILRDKDILLEIAECVLVQ